jgi:hypothetical protein
MSHGDQQQPFGVFLRGISKKKKKTYRTKKEGENLQLRTQNPKRRLVVHPTKRGELGNFSLDN